MSSSVLCRGLSSNSLPNLSSCLHRVLTKTLAVRYISGSDDSLFLALVTATMIHTILLWVLVPSVSSIEGLSFLFVKSITNF